MAAITVTRAPNNLTDANFRAWGPVMSDQLLAGGWVKTSDTGQIDWVTVLAPTGFAQSSGYEIWRSNDAGGGLVEFFIKLEWGSSVTSAAQPAMWITIGWGSDGAGNITGTATTGRVQLWSSQSSGSTAGTHPCYLAAGTGWFAFSMFCTVQGTALYLGVERSVADNDTFNNEIVLSFQRNGLSSSNSNAGLSTQVLQPTITSVVEQEGSFNYLRLNATDMLVGSDFGLMYRVAQCGSLTNPIVNVLGCVASHIGAAASTISHTMYGVSHTYILVEAGTGGPFFATSGRHMLMRYE